MIWRCGKRGDEGIDCAVTGTRSFAMTSLCNSLKISADCEVERFSTAGLDRTNRSSSTLHLESKSPSTVA